MLDPNAIDDLALHELTEELLHLQRLLEESGGEVTEEIDEYFDSLDLAREQKVRGYVYLMQQQELQAEAAEGVAAAIVAQAEPFEKRAKLKRRVYDALGNRLLASMTLLGHTEYPTPFGRVYRRRSVSEKAVPTVEVDALPEAFRRVKVTPNLSALKRALKDGDPDAMEVGTLERNETWSLQFSHTDVSK